MPGKSNKTRVVSIRLSVATHDEIQRLIENSPKQQSSSVTEYCQQVIERYVWRHSARKYRKDIY